MFKSLRNHIGLGLADLLFSLIIFSMALAIVSYSIVTQNKFQALVKNRVAISREARSVIDIVSRVVRVADPSSIVIMDPTVYNYLICTVPKGSIGLASPTYDTEIRIYRRSDTKHVSCYRRYIGAPAIEQPFIIEVADNIYAFNRTWDSANRNLDVSVTSTIGNQSVTLNTRVRVLEN